MGSIYSRHPNKLIGKLRANSIGKDHPITIDNPSSAYFDDNLFLILLVLKKTKLGIGSKLLKS